MPNFDHFAFQVRDLDTSIRFYIDKLGFRALSQAVNDAQGEAYAFLASGDLRLELIQDLNHPDFISPTPRPPYCPHLALLTCDMAGTLTSLQAGGVEIIHGPLEIPGEETWLYFKDPDNNVLEFIQWFEK
jgi:lactoylglutathione lyase